MNSLALYAYLNRWRRIHPRDKMAFALVSMILSLLSPAPLAALLVLTLMVFLSLFKTGVPARVYLTAGSVPLVFLLVGAVTVGLTISQDVGQLAWKVNLGAYAFGFTRDGIGKATLLLARSSGAAACLLFLAFSTPIEDLTGQLRRWRVPAIIIEMMTLVYRFIYVLWEQVVTIHTAQAARLGHVDLKTGMRSLASLISSMLINVIHRSNALYNSLVARNYSDSLQVLEEGRWATPGLVIFGFILFDLAIFVFIIKGSAWF